MTHTHDDDTCAQMECTQCHAISWAPCQSAYCDCGWEADWTFVAEVA